jgi:hypothetical protein
MKFVSLVALLCCIACRVNAMSPVGDTAIYQQTFCSNQIVIINGHVYGPFQTQGIEVIPGGGANGMDSIFKVMLTFNQAVEVPLHITLCEGDSVKVNNTFYHQNFFEGKEVFENAAANGCDSIVKVKLTFIPPPFSNYIDTLCSDGFITVNGNRYDVQNRNGLEIIENGAYNGCDSLVYISLFFRYQYVNIGPDTTVIEGDSVCISVQAQFFPQLVEWSPQPPCADPECLTFCTARLLRPESYSIIYTDTFGCVSRDEVSILVNKKHNIYGPNVFNPDLDEPNSRFFVVADRGVVLIRKLLVYDRWGEPVFSVDNVPNDPSSAFNMGWDGTKNGTRLHNDVFMWYAELETFSGEILREAGDVALIR